MGSIGGDRRRCRSWVVEEEMGGVGEGGET